MINVIISPQFEQCIVTDDIKGIVLSSLKHLKMDDETDISVVIDDDRAIQELNCQYRGINHPTDVLSFPADFIDPDTGNRYLGDIIISYPSALETAQKGGYAAIEEIKLLIIHGVLHLAGYDHDRSDDKEKMWLLQREILTLGGVDSRTIR